MRPAQRIQEVQEYYFSLKLKEIAQLNAQGHRVLNLGIGNPDQAPSAATIQSLVAQAQQPDTHGYQSYVGIPELRQAYAQWYKQWYSVELNANTEILPLIGSKEGIMHVSMAFVNPGDQVLVPNPGYPTYAAVAQLVQAETVYYTLQEHQGWLPDFDALEQMDLSRVRLMWVNYPHMPTGTPATRAVFERLIDFGRRHQILIVNDNPYSFILNDRPLSILQVPGALEVAMELNSLSKSHNMAGWRMGMVAGSAEHIQYVLRVKSNMDSGTFRPMQSAAATALTQNGAEWFTHINQAYRQRRVVVEEIMHLLGARFDPAQVGMFLWARIDDRYPDSGALSDDVLHRAKVFLTPGFIFGSAGRQYIRISLCSSLEMLTEAKERIAAIL